MLKLKILLKFKLSLKLIKVFFNIRKIRSVEIDISGLNKIQVGKSRMIIKKILKRSIWSG